MKHIHRRRRPLRPRPTRSQLNQQIQRVSTTMQLFQIEWLAEAQRPVASRPRLQFLHDAILLMQEEISNMESL